MLVGFISGVLGCALWGFIYLVPLLAADYNSVSIAMCRFTFFGVGSFFFVKKYWPEIRQLSKRDWFDAFCLAFIGNAVYYIFLSQGIKFSGAPLAGMLMAFIPVLVALITNRKSAENSIVVPWSKLSIPLLMILVGLFIANQGEFDLVKSGAGTMTFWIGALCSTIAMLLWVWFPVENARWLLRHPQVSPFAWTTAQGLAILPVTIACYLVANWDAVLGSKPLFGPEPLQFIGLMCFAGIVCGWGGMALWNFMSSRLPPALSGQMIVFETIFSVIYAFIYREEWPEPMLIFGFLLLVSGVFISLKLFRNAAESAKHNRG